MKTIFESKKTFKDGIQALARKGAISILFSLGVTAFSFAVDYYVDPTYTGSGTGGTMANPWKILGTAEWSTINSALLSQNVNIYFSARLAGSISGETYGNPSEIDLNKRTASNFMLTLDGRSKYNNSDLNPSNTSWVANTSQAKCLVHDFNSQSDTHEKRSNITVDGFVITANTGKAVYICGDNWTLRNCNVSHSATPKTPSDGPLINIIPTSDAAREGSSAYCFASNNILIENNDIHDSYGELVYVGGGGCSSTDPHAGSVCIGFPAHTNVTIRNNKIHDGATRGAQGDGIDIKGGLMNLTITGNEIYNLNTSARDARGIVTQGARDNDDQKMLIANNYIHDCTGFEDAAIAIVNSWGTPHGVEVRNNLIVNTNAVGIKVYDGSSLNFYNNTIYNSGSTGILTQSGNGLLKNNLLITNGGPVSLSGSFSSSFNGYSGTSWSGCTTCIGSLSASVFALASGDDFRLAASASAINSGTPITSSISPFTTDIDGNPRPYPSGGAWDMGAYEYGSTGGGSTPFITSHPQDQTVIVGSKATFSIQATGSAPLSYKWRKNGVDISPAATGASYTTPNTVTGDNNALFSCLVTNSLGSVPSNNAKLTVTTGAPVITAQPANQSAVVGQPAIFSITVTGLTPLTYQWKRNGTSISAATSASYTTPATTMSDSGTTFSCAVTNSAGSVTSAAATLTVTNDIIVAATGPGIYPFTISTPGDYKLIGLVSAPADGSNSFYINVDADPLTDTVKSWDMIFPTVDTEQDVSWRGPSATCFVNSCAAENPKIFNLLAGPHNIYLNDREVGTTIRQFRVVSAENLHPGDADKNFKLTLNEAAQYGACWRSAPAIPTGCPTPAATLDSSVRAGTIWNSTSDGSYHYDSTKTCPLCWVAP